MLACTNAHQAGGEGGGRLLFQFEKSTKLGDAERRLLTQLGCATSWEPGPLLPSRSVGAPSLD